MVVLMFRVLILRCPICSVSRSGGGSNASLETRRLISMGERSQRISRRSTSSNVESSEVLQRVVEVRTTTFPWRSVSEGPGVSAELRVAVVTARGNDERRSVPLTSALEGNRASPSSSLRDFYGVPPSGQAKTISRLSQCALFRSCPRQLKLCVTLD